jgi:uncharacterized protein
MKDDHLGGWIRFLTSPAAPATAMRPLELDGYLTGVIVAPDLIPPGEWIEGLWGEDEPMFDTREQLQTVLDSVMGHYNATIALIDERGPGHRPMFMDADGTADLEKVHIWVRGFWQAMALAPEAWSSLADDERTGILLEPFATLIDLDAIEDGPMPDNIEEMRRSSAELIPRVLPALRQLGQMRAGRPPARPSAHRKTGRNDPCPCRSGKKHKRCCGRN